MTITSQQQRREQWLIGLLIVIMLTKGVVWSLAFPLWQGPDEEDHYGVIQFIGELGRLPDEADEALPDEVALSRVLADVGRLPYSPEQRQRFSNTAVGPGEAAFAGLPEDMRSSFEQQAVGKLNHATPLYYYLSAAIYRLSAAGDLLQRAQVQRLLSVAISLPLVVVAYLITRLLFPTDPAMRLTIPALLVFHPMVSEIAAVVSADGFYFLCYSLLIYLSLRVFQDGFDWRYGLSMGAIFAIGMLTKPTLSGFAPLIALLIAYDWWRDRTRRRAVFIGAVVMGIVILLPVGWWMLRSLRLSQDLFYFNPVLKGHRIIQNPFYDYTIGRHLLDYYGSVWGGVFVSWWGHFGWIDTPMPPWVYNILRGTTLLAVAGLVAGLVRGRGRSITMTRWTAGQTTAPWIVWAFLALSIIVPVVLLQFYDLTFWWQYGNGRGLQGRYWLGTVIPALLLLVTGLLMLVPRPWQPGVHTLVRAGMIALNFLALLGYILPRFLL